jgi:hypothetical protein
MDTTEMSAFDIDLTDNRRQHAIDEAVRRVILVRYSPRSVIADEWYILARFPNGGQKWRHFNHFVNDIRGEFRRIMS